MTAFDKLNSLKRWLENSAYHARCLELEHRGSNYGSTAYAMRAKQVQEIITEFNAPARMFIFKGVRYLHTPGGRVHTLGKADPE